MLPIVGPIYIFKDVLHTPIIFNMDAIGKNAFFHNSVYVNDYGTNFHLKSGHRKRFLCYVNVGLANITSMLNVAVFYSIVFGKCFVEPGFYLPAVHINVQKHCLSIFSVNME